MNVSEHFIRRPVGTTLLMVAIALAGAVGYLLLPVAPLPEVEFPTISVSGGLPGASPETMASAVATPLERQFGRIAGITEMTSTSTLGSTNVTIQFDLNRDIDAAARDVQAAINAARGQLPANLPNNPNYRKVNPADAPILMLALTSTTTDKAHMYDAASSILQQKIAQVPGVGQVVVGGGALPAVRVEVNPLELNQFGLGFEDLRTALAAANVNEPKGALMTANRTWSIASTDQLLHADQYAPLVIRYDKGTALRLADVARVVDSVEDVRTGGLANGKPAILMLIFRQPGANIIETVDRIRDLLPQLRASIPPAITLTVMQDRTTTIRASVRDVELTLCISIGLVILVVFVFLRSGRSTLIPAVAVPISLIGTFGAMYLLRLHARQPVADGAHHRDRVRRRRRDRGDREHHAAPRGRRGAVRRRAERRAGDRLHRDLDQRVARRRVHPDSAHGRHRRAAVPRVRGHALGRDLHLDGRVADHDADDVRAAAAEPQGRAARARLRGRASGPSRGFSTGTSASLGWVLRHQPLVILITLATMAATVYLYVLVPKGFFPQQDTGRLNGTIQADQDTSFQAMQQRIAQFSSLVIQDPAVDTAMVYVGGNGTENTARMFAALKDDRGRKETIDEVIARIRRKATAIPGGTLVLQAVQDVRVGGRASAAQYQYTLQGDNVSDLNTWSPKVYERLRGAAGARGRQHRSADQGPAGVARDRSRHGLARSASRHKRSTTRSTTRSASGRCRRCSRRSISTT